MAKNRFSRWRPPPSWILKILIFGHMTIIAFIICCSVPNFIKIGWFFTEIWWFSDFQNGGRPPAWICYDVTILHRRTHFRCPNVVLEFLFDRWCSFRDTCNIVRQPFGCTQRTMAILGLRMRCITWPLVEGSKITTRMKFLTPICLFTMPLFRRLRWRLRGVRGASLLLINFSLRTFFCFNQFLVFVFC